MKSDQVVQVCISTALILLGCVVMEQASAQGPQGIIYERTSAVSQVAEPPVPAASDLIQPEQLANAVKSAAAVKPIIIQVGFRILFTQAHIPGSEFIGPGNSPDAIRQLRRRVETLPRLQSIVIYCGCCPWSDCPNVNPAYRELRFMGFRNVKILYIANNFGKDWVEKGYPVEKGAQ